MAIHIQHIQGGDIAAWLPQLAALRIRVFREYPYLYEGTEAYERKYLQTYVESDTSIAVLALEDGKVVGASTGLALRDEDQAFVRPFRNAGIEVDAVFYCAESVLLPEYRGRGIYQHFFAGREEQARSLPGIRLMAFCAVQRPDTHPRRPVDYLPLDAVWRKFGYTRQEGLRTDFSWQDLDEESASPKPMVFYTKPL